MKKIMLIFLIATTYLYSNISRKNIDIIQKNILFECNFNEEIIPLEGENFKGSYYKGEPYGFWTLKNGRVKQCFLNGEKRYYSEGKYYIVDTPNYYFRRNYESNIYTIKNKKKNNKVYYYEEKNGKYIERKDIVEKIKVPKFLYNIMYFKREPQLRIREDIQEEISKIFEKEK